MVNYTKSRRAVGEASVTITLIPSVVDQLRALQKRTNLSITDLVNRAITSYAFLDDQMRAGNDLMLRNNLEGDTKLVRFL